MSKIVNSPLMYSQQEVQDRFQMHRFIHKLFNPCKAHTGDLLGLPADELYHVFRIQYPMNVLNSAITSHMLLTGGFIDQEDPEQSILYATVNEEYFMGLKKEAKICLLPYIKDPMAIRFRQILMGIKIIKKHESIIINPEFSIKLFVNMFTLNRNNADNYMNTLTVEHRSSATDVYNYYVILCSLYKWQYADKNTFNNVLQSLGYATTKGRVYNKAGMRYYKGLYIPKTIEDKILSVQMNMCCIKNESDTHYTIAGILENYIEAQRSKICNDNLERMGFDESERQKIEEEKAKLDIRRTFEEGAIPLGQTETSLKTQNDLGCDVGLESKSQTSEIQIDQTESMESIPRTSGFKEQEGNNSSADDNPVEYTVDFTEPLDIGETYRDRYAQLCADTECEANTEDTDGSNNEELGGEPVEDNGPSIEQIASALTVPYKMTPPGEFTKEVMSDWLHKMNLPEPESILERYDDIMEILK